MGKSFGTVIGKATPETLEEAKERKANSLAWERYRREIAGIDVGGVQVDTSRESQSLITSAYISLRDGFVAEADWKTPTGVVRMTLAEIEPIARAVAVHIQTLRTAESAVLDQLSSMTTIVEVLALDVAAAMDAALA